MSGPHHQLQPTAFQRLREQLATAIALCDDGHILTLADDLHDALRRRRAARHAHEEPTWPPEARSWAPTSAGVASARMTASDV